MKKPKLSKAGKVYLIFLFLIMEAVYFTKNVNDPWHMRILGGILGFVLTFFASGLVMLAFFIAFYFAIKISVNIEEPQTENAKELLGYGEKLTDALYIVCYMISYITILFWM